MIFLVLLTFSILGYGTSVLEIESRNYDRQKGKTAAIRKYKIGQLLGEGNHGKVYAGVDEATGEKVAVKVEDLKVKS